MKSHLRYLTVAGASALAITLAACSGATPPADGASPATETTVAEASSTDETEAAETTEAAAERPDSKKKKGDLWTADDKTVEITETIKVTGDEPDAVAEGRLKLNEDAEPIEKVGEREEDLVALLGEDSALLRSMPSLKGAKEPNDCQLIIRTGGKDEVIEAPDGQGRQARTCGPVSASESHIAWVETKAGENVDWTYFVYDRETQKVAAVHEETGVPGGGSDTWGSGPRMSVIGERVYFEKPAEGEGKEGVFDIASTNLAGEDLSRAAQGSNPFNYGERIGFVQWPSVIEEGNTEPGFALQNYDAEGTILVPFLQGNFGQLTQAPIVSTAPGMATAILITPEGENSKIILYNPDDETAQVFDLGEKAQPHDVWLNDELLVFTGGSGLDKDFVFDRGENKLYTVKAAESGAGAFLNGSTVGVTIDDERPGREDFGRVVTGTWQAAG